MSEAVEEAALRTMTTRQLAKASGIAEWRLNQMIRDGKGPPFFWVGKTRRFRVADVEAWMIQQTRNTQES